MASVLADMCYVVCCILTTVDFEESDHSRSRRPSSMLSMSMSSVLMYGCFPALPKLALCVSGRGPGLLVSPKSLLCDKNSLNSGLSVAAQEAVILSPVSLQLQIATSVVVYRKSDECARVEMYGIRTMVAIEALHICQWSLDIW